MTVTLLFALLSLLTIAGAGGLLFLRRIEHCLLSFLLCAAALAGLYLLLNLQFLAAIQTTVGVSLMGIAFATVLPRSQEQRRGAHRLWYTSAAIAFGAVACWGIVNGAIGEPVLISAPAWAVRGGLVPALGHELVTTYLIPFALLGLLLLVCIVSVTYLYRSAQEADR
jgi:NADH:ubiquinone oxidoreductase subunit 6 (subunit J)